MLYCPKLLIRACTLSALHFCLENFFYFFLLFHFFLWKRWMIFLQARAVFMLVSDIVLFWHCEVQLKLTERKIEKWNIVFCSWHVSLIIYVIYFHFFLYFSWCNYSGKLEQSKPYQYCHPCWFLPDRGYSRHYHSCLGCTFPASAVHNLQTKAERQRNKYALSDLYTCYESHQCRLHHFR